MRLVHQQDINGGLAALNAPPNMHALQTLVNAAAGLHAATGNAAVTDHFTAAARGAGGWQKEFQAYTPYVLPAGGRPSGIDLYHAASRIGIELEFSNQTAMSHDLLKLITLHRNGHADLCLLVTLGDAARANLGYNANNSYLTFQTAHRYLQRFQGALGQMPFVLLGFE